MQDIDMSVEALVSLRPAGKTETACRDSLDRIQAAFSAAEQRELVLRDQSKMVLEMSAADLVRRRQEVAEVVVWKEQLEELHDAVERELDTVLKAEKLAELLELGKRANAAVAAVNATISVEYADCVQRLLQLAELPRDAMELSEHYLQALESNGNLAADLPAPLAVKKFFVQGWAARGPLHIAAPLGDLLCLPSLPDVSEQFVGTKVRVGHYPVFMPGGSLR